jgi:hypothetical protein
MVFFFLSFLARLPFYDHGIATCQSQEKFQ